MAVSKYTIETWYSTNTFGADEHYNVGLYRNRDLVNVWSYSTFISPSLAHSRAERKIRKLVRTYGATVD
jgi:hypothetical protein